jgi:hypothetical protein
LAILSPFFQSIRGDILKTLEGDPMKNAFAALAAFILILTAHSALAAEVGYINILNGQLPEEAFLIDRQGESIAPDEVSTSLEEGDVVKPSPGSDLLFTPADVSCPPVVVTENFVAGPCVKAQEGLDDLVYDYIDGEFMAAPAEEVGLYATRGYPAQKAFTLPLRAIKLFAQTPELAESLGKNPFWSFVNRQSQADLVVSGTPASVTISKPSGEEPMDFRLPADDLRLKRALMARINYETISALKSTSEWPAGLTWKVELFTLSQYGSVNYGGRKWQPTETISVVSSATRRFKVPKSCLLMFGLENKSSTPLYAYLASYSDQGQVLLALPPENSAAFPNRIPAGGSLDLSKIYLELGAPVERVRLIVSERPLNMSQFSQDSLEAPKSTKPVALRPISEGDWQTAQLVFLLDQ